jgi:hypothetical protein
MLNLQKGLISPPELWTRLLRDLFNFSLWEALQTAALQGRRRNTKVFRTEAPCHPEAPGFTEATLMWKQPCAGQLETWRFSVKLGSDQMAARECPGQSYPGMKNKADIQEKRLWFTVGHRWASQKTFSVIGRAMLFSQLGDTHITP